MCGRQRPCKGPKALTFPRRVRYCPPQSACPVHGPCGKAQRMRILVLNPGSSSLKFHVRETSSAADHQAVIASGQFEWSAAGMDYDHTLSTLLDEVDEHTGRPEGIGHRVVHGGAHYDGSTLVTPEVVETIKSLSTLAPLHNPVSAESIDVCARHWPGRPQVAVFDKGFHSTIPDFAALYASGADGSPPDVVLACAGDVPTRDTLTVAWLLRKHVPAMRVRVANVIDAMALTPSDSHPHGLSEGRFEQLFAAGVDVVMAWHGYARALHQLLHGRPGPERFHVRGYNEQGTTTTPFDMVVLNKVSRYHLVMEAMHRSARQPEGTQELLEHCEGMLAAHRHYIREHFADMPEARDWVWSDPAN